MQFACQYCNDVQLLILLSLVGFTWFSECCYREHIIDKIVNVQSASFWAIRMHVVSAEIHKLIRI